MEAIEEVAPSRNREVYGNYCQEVACIREKLRAIPLGEEKRRGRLAFRLDDIESRLIPRILGPISAG